jgi:hypothetical protein
MPRRARHSLPLAAASLLLAASAAPAAAQPGYAGAPAGSLAASLRDVFHFGSCEQLICLSLQSPGEHGAHYNPAALQVAESFVGFVGRAIQTSVANIPLGATSSGTLFEIGPAGVPVPVASSTGPIFGERAQTLGRGRFLVGANVTGSAFQSLRGVSLDDLRLTLTHSDEDPSGLGSPGFERDTIGVRTALQASMQALSVYLTYGLTNRIDVGVVVPVVRLSVDGWSVGTIVPTIGTAVHFWEGTIDAPQLVDTTRSQGSATGLGDVAARVKFNLTQSPRAGAAFLADVRLPTGDEDDLLGSGELAVRGLLVTSARVGQMTPHANVGFIWREGTDQNNALLGMVGFDALAAPGLTLAADLSGEYQIGASRLTLPPSTRYLDGSIVRSTNIRGSRDHQLTASVGAKYALAGDFLAIGNVLLPLGDNGMRPGVYWTFGLERTF